MRTDPSEPRPAGPSQPDQAGPEARAHEATAADDGAGAAAGAPADATAPAADPTPAADAGTTAAEGPAVELADDAPRYRVADLVDPATVRRAPRFGRFILTGVVLGALVSFAVTLFPGSSALARSDLFWLVFVTLGTVGGLAGAGLAVRADRRSWQRRQASHAPRAHEAAGHQDGAAGEQGSAAEEAAATPGPGAATAAPAEPDDRRAEERPQP
ncbi:hypothetical protein [Georgenia sp. AZ-5]|uniref:hypothetical protein n=1 Tax=Georgenia sp. AZ-5 TaxID=3367526 RepID=UPI0037545CDE